MSRVNIKDRLHTNSRINMNHFDEIDNLEIYKVFDDYFYPSREKVIWKQRRKNMYVASSILCGIGAIVYQKDIEDENDDINDIYINDNFKNNINIVNVSNGNNEIKEVVFEEKPLTKEEESQLQEAIEIAKASLERHSENEVVDLKLITKEKDTNEASDDELNKEEIKEEVNVIKNYEKIDEKNGEIKNNKKQNHYFYNLEEKLSQSLNVARNEYSKEQIVAPKINNAMKYWSYFEYYGYTYGVDPYLLLAMATQESGGEHYTTIPGGDRFNGYGYGIMQIEKPGIVTKKITAYNHTTESYDIMHINEEKDIYPVAQNIKAGAMILAQRLKENQYNPYVTIQGYNYGFLGIKYALSYYLVDGNLEEIDSVFKEGEGKDLLKYIESNNSDWLNKKTSTGLTAREWYSSEGWKKFGSSGGDKNYFENVMKYYNGKLSPYIIKNTGIKICF